MSGLGAQASATPLVLGQDVPGVPDPASALVLSQGAGSSALPGTGTVYVGIDFGGVLGRTTLGNSLTSITMSAAGNVITTTFTLPSTAQSTGVYVGTTSPPTRLGVVTGTSVVYDSPATTGLTVSVTGSTVQLTISDVASSTIAPHTVNQATTVCVTAANATENTPPPAPTTIIGSIVATNMTTQDATVTLLVVPSGATTWNPAYQRWAGLPLTPGQTEWGTGLGIPLQPGMTIQAAQSVWLTSGGAVAVNLDGVVVQ